MQSTQCGRYLVWVCGDRIASRGMEDFACRVSLPACLPTKFTQSRESAGASPGGFVRYGLGCSGAGADGGTWRDPHILPSSCRAAHQADGGESGAVRSPACFWTAGVWPRYSSNRAEHGPVCHQRHPASVPRPRSPNHRAYSRIATMNSKKGFYPCYPQDGPRPAAVSASRCTAARHRLNAHTWYSTKSNNWCER